MKGWRVSNLFCLEYSILTYDIINLENLYHLQGSIDIKKIKKEKYAGRSKEKFFKADM